MRGLAVTLTRPRGRASEPIYSAILRNVSLAGEGINYSKFAMCRHTGKKRKKSTGARVPGYRATGNCPEHFVQMARTATHPNRPSIRIRCRNRAAQPATAIRDEKKRGIRE
ncbi:hypothetical protein BVIET440_60111 [Burkholderia vietnamiensis]